MQTILHPVKALVFLWAIVSGYSSLAQNTETRSLENFQTIEIRNRSKVRLIKGSPSTATISTNDKAVTEVNTGVSGGTLKISGAPADIILTLPELRVLSVSGSANVTADSTFNGQNLEINISGSGVVVLPLDYTNIELNISGYGKAIFAGEADNLEINVSGSGKVNADNMIVKKCISNVSGVSRTVVDVRDELEMNTSGSSQLFYKTQPAKIENNSSGISRYNTISSESGLDTTMINIGTKSYPIMVKPESKDNETGSVSNSSDNNYSYNYQWDSKNEWDWDFDDDNKASSHWMGIDLGFNQLMYDGSFKSTPPDDYEFLELNSGKSVNVNINIFSHDFEIHKRYVMFTTGIGLTLQNYHFNSDKVLVSDTNRVYSDFRYMDSGERIYFSKSKLAVNYVTLPILLQFNTRPDYNHSFHIGTGVLIHYKYNSHTKTVYSENGDKVKDKDHDEFNISPFRADLTLRMGYKWFTVYASYGLTEFFKDDRGPEAHPFNFGLHFGI